MVTLICIDSSFLSYDKISFRQMTIKQCQVSTEVRSPLIYFATQDVLFKHSKHHQSHKWDRFQIFFHDYYFSVKNTNSFENLGLLLLIIKQCYLIKMKATVENQRGRVGKLFSQESQGCSHCGDTIFWLPWVTVALTITILQHIKLTVADVPISHVQSCKKHLIAVVKFKFKRMFFFGFFQFLCHTLQINSIFFFFILFARYK